MPDLPDDAFDDIGIPEGRPMPPDPLDVEEPLCDKCWLHHSGECF